LRVLVTEPTGYIGGRLMTRLSGKGHAIRCLARDPRRLEGRPWSGVEVVAGDVGDPAVLGRALDGVEVAYYLVHSMAEGHAFREKDRTMALAFGQAAARVGVRRIIYLGGLGDPARVHSKHLVSRQEVGRCLPESGVAVVEFRAAVIVGSGSASFEIIRHLTERLPVMISPLLINTKCQPIGVHSVQDYLEEALDLPDAAGIFEIGGTDVMTYKGMMMEYARIRGLQRRILPFPVPRPDIASHWIDLVTPVPFRIAHPLVESLQFEVVVRYDLALRTFSVRPSGFTEAVNRALARMATDDVETTWASSLASVAPDQ